jgi:hypothetical protein
MSGVSRTITGTDMTASFLITYGTWPQQTEKTQGSGVHYSKGRTIQTGAGILPVFQVISSTFLLSHRNRVVIKPQKKKNLRRKPV